MSDNMTKNVRPSSRRVRRERSSKSSSTLKWNDPSIKLQHKSNATPSLDIKDYDPVFALRKIALLYEKDQNEATSHIITNISWSTLEQIYTKFPIDLFIEAIPRSLCVLDALYSRFFIKDPDNFPVKTLPLAPIVVQVVKLYARHQAQDLPKMKDWDSHEKHFKNILKIVGYKEGSSSIRMLSHRRQCLERAVKGLGRHGLVEVEVSPADEEEVDKQLMSLSDALRVELNRMTINCKRALNKLAIMEKSGEFISSSSSAKGHKHSQTGNSKGQKSNNQYAPVVSSNSECNHQRIFQLTSSNVQDRLYQNKVILNVLEPIMHYAQLPWLLTVLQERIERDKDMLLTFSQLRKEILSVTPNAKLAPALTHYAEAFTTVINLLKKYVDDDVDANYATEELTGEEDSKFSLVHFNLFEYNKLSSSSNFSGSLAGSLEPAPSSTDACVGNKSSSKQDAQEIALLKKEKDRLRQELHKSQRAIDRLRKREKDLIDRLSIKAESTLQQSKSFEKISPGLHRSSELVDLYRNLYSGIRVQALDGIEIAITNCGRNIDISDIKNKLLFSVVVLAFRSAADTLDNLKIQMQELLCMSNTKQHMSSAVQNIENAVQNYLREIGESYNLDENCNIVFDQVCDALYDCPQLRTTSSLFSYVKECVTLAWLLSIQVPPYTIEYDSNTYDPTRHDRFHTSNISTTHIDCYLWPSLIDKQAGRCMSKGVVITDL